MEIWLLSRLFAQVVDAASQLSSLQTKEPTGFADVGQASNWDCPLRWPTMTGLAMPVDEHPK